MFKFIKYEWHHWLRSPMLWIFLLIITLLVMGAVSSEQVQIGGGVGSVFKNAPSVIQSYYGVMSLICLLMTTAFMNASANRDFSTGMYQFIFTSPIKKRHYFFGKFLGAMSIAIIPLLGVSIGALIGPLMPWAQEGRYGAVIWNGHWWGILGFAIPNTFIAAAMLYSLAVVFRSNIVSFVGAMLILILYVVSQGFTADIEKEWLANLLDPFGFQPLETLSKYRTVEEQNLTATPLIAQFLVNRLLWIGISLLLLLGMYWRFSFQPRGERLRKKKKAETDVLLLHDQSDVKRFAPDQVKGWSWQTCWHMFVFETKAVLRNQVFIILVIIGLINLVASLTSFTGSYGTARYPVTYDVIDTIRGAFNLFILAIIIFYAGVLVWKERDAKIAEIEDATPIRTALLFFPKYLALVFSVAVVLCSAILVGMVAQLLHGYTRFELGVYVQSILVLDLLGFATLAVLAILFHYLINNRYIAYFAFVAFVVLNSFLWSVLEINTNMLPFGATPFVMYSDMNGFGPFVLGQVWFNLYWGLFCVILLLIGEAFYVRGKETGFWARLKFARQRLGANRVLLTGSVLAFLGCAAFVYYNTEVLNTYISGKEMERRQKEYELTYKAHEQLAQPRWISFNYEIDIHPYARDLYVTVDAQVVNKSNEPISELHFSLPSMPDSLRIDLPGAVLSLNDQRLLYRIYQLEQPLAPGATLPVRMVLYKETRGFENEVSFTSLTHNGTFFNNFDILPSLGYDAGREIRNKNKRKKLDLPARRRMPPLDELDLASRSNTYLGKDADWVSVTTTISTSPDQLAVAPGSLLEEWEADGRRYFRYQLDQPSLNFYSFISARYEVARRRWQGVDLEVYYIAGHEYNVPNMLESLEKSLAYYTQHFGPYYHKQCRIIEFPRYSSFAQAFPGTMPYSEGIGFIVDLRKVTEDDIDLVYYVVAHEMAHQYWAHQVVGANMRGSELLSEGFSQYAALMVMEEAYGRDKMKKFLKYEMNGYLRGRSNEFEAERPLMETEQQGYIHYSKASVVMYYLKEMIGEDQVNAALRRLISDYAYQEPPYPTSLAAVRAFRAVTPDSLQYLITDLFEEITIFSNRVLEATYKPEGEGYRVSFTTHAEKYWADSLGKETPMVLDDYIDIGVFGATDAKHILGQPLVYERVKITDTEQSFSFYVDALPVQVGIDPYNYLVDRVPDDNVKKPVLLE